MEYNIHNNNNISSSIKSDKSSNSNKKITYKYKVIKIQFKTAT